MTSVPLYSEPWHNEPDEEKFTDPTTGFPCVILRGPCDHLCGYVAVPADHRLFGESYNSRLVVGPRERKMLSRPVGTASPLAILLAFRDEPDGVERVSLDLLVDVHGGITYAEGHLPGQEDDGKWWFGFDCAHSGDLLPRDSQNWARLFAEGRSDRPVYRDLTYVRAECSKLARQLQELSTP